MRTLILSILLISSGVLPALARDILVSNTAGDDRYVGRQWGAVGNGDGPVRTINRALQLAEPGDRIVLAATGQPYHETVSLVGNRNSGFSYQPLVIAGHGAVLDGSAPVPADEWKFYAGSVFMFRPPVGGHQMLFLGYRPLVCVPAGEAAQRPPKLRPLEWCFFEGSIYFCVEHDKLPRDYALRYASLATGITLYHVENVAILDLVVEGFRTDGISLANSARNVRLTGVTCRGNGRSGVAVGGASSVLIESSLLGNNGRAQLLTLPLSETHVHRSNLLPLTAPAWVDQGGRFYLEEKLLHGGLEKISPTPDEK